MPRVLACLVLACGATVAAPTLVVKDGRLLRDGQPYRAVGVNMFSAFSRTLEKPDDTSYDASFAALAKAGIPFARFMGCGFWPSNHKLYQEDPKAYWARFDSVVAAAGKHGVGLIPSLFWMSSTLPDLAGEPLDQWGNPRSKTHELMRAYVTEMVTRYRDSPVIWAWEFGNEYNLGADLPNAAEHLPPVWPTLGTAKVRTMRDALTHDQIRIALAEFGRAVRRIDPLRPITTGHSMPRPSAWHQRYELKWTKDDPDQYREMLDGDTPDPCDVISVHAYGDDIGRLKLTAELAKAIGKPLFVGEFGVEGPDNAANRAKFAALLQTVETLDVPLAALWVYDYGSQDDWSVTASNGRAWQIDAIAQANARLRGAR